MEDAYRQKEVEQGCYSSIEWTVSGRVTFPWGEAVYQADDLTSANQVIPDGLGKSHIPGRG